MEEGEKEYMLQIQHICKEYRTAIFRLSLKREIRCQ